MRTLRLSIAYDGTAYVGWQRQPNGLSIQQLIEDALAPFVAPSETPVVTGASRTDAGVHALGQVASVRVPFVHPVEAIQRALNIRLPQDVRILDVADAEPGFHARLDARRKRYRYRLARGPVVLPMKRWFVWHVPERLDVDAMREAAQALVGTHDFASFQATGSTVVDTRRTIHRIDLIETADELQIEVEGDGFLRHMVRIVTGSIVDVGAGTRPAAWLGEALAARDRRAAGRTAPPSGLVLEQVFYGDR
jgi:tRNA pseudouridine38-40 synthase